MTTPLRNLELRSLISRAGQLELSLVESDLAAARARPGPRACRGDADQSIGPRAAARPRRSRDRARLTGTPTARSSPRTVPPAAAADGCGRVSINRLPSAARAQASSSMPAKARARWSARPCRSRRAACTRAIGSPAPRVHGAPRRVTPAQGASAFVNPMTALSMIETMRREGHTALVHTAAASNLGQMLVRVCAHDKRAARQHRAQRRTGQRCCASSARLTCSTAPSPSFRDEPRRSGRRDRRHAGIRCDQRRPLAGQILACDGESRRAARPRATAATARARTSRSTSTVASTCGRPRSTRTASGSPGASAAGCCRRSSRRPAARSFERLRTRVLAELTTTFASHYTATLEPRRGAPARRGPRVRQSRHRREVPDRSEPVR